MAQTRSASSPPEPARYSAASEAQILARSVMAIQAVRRDCELMGYDQIARKLADAEAALTAEFNRVKPAHD